MKEQKATYLAPHIEVITMENEGVIATSSLTGSPGLGEGTHLGKSSPTKNSYSRSASTSDLEDLINDILTIEQ